MGFPLFLKKILQYRFGIDANEFLSKSTIEEVNIAGMNTKAVVHHREMMDTPGLKTIDRQHHVCGIQRMNEVSDDAIRLLPRVDLPCFILLINNERAIRRRDAQGLRFPGLMNNTETSRCCPRHASIHLRQSASHVTKPVHDVARLNGDFGNAFLQDFRQIPGAFLRIFAVLCGLFLDEFPVNRPTRYTIWSRHRCMLDDGTIDLSEQLPGWISIVPRGFALSGSRFALSGIFRVSRYTAADVICDFLVNILRLISRNQVGGASADRIAAHGTQMLVSVTGAIHTHRQMRPKIGTFLSIAFPLLTGSQEGPRFIGFVPKSGKAEGIIREGQDFLFVLMDPCQALVERNFILLPVAVGNVDRQPISSTLSKRLAFRKFEQRPSDIVRLRINQLRHGISAAPMVQLVRKIR